MWGKVSTPSNLPDVVVSPWIVTLPPGGTQVFTANTPGSPGEANISYTWSGPNGVTLTNGEYTAPDTTLSPTPIIITARRNDDATKFGAATVLLSGSKDHALQIVPGAAVLRLGQLFPFAASGAGGSHADVEWKVPSNVGHVLPDGLYRAPNSVEDSQTIAILAKSKDGSQAAANITLLPSVDNSGRTTYLLFFVLVIGALGSCLHGLSSFVTFVGNRQFVSSWFWWYLFQPLMGGILALLVFFVIGGGFLAGQSTSNTLQVAAIAGLVGLFSAQATLKLKDLVETIFTTRSDARSGKLTESLKPSIMSVNPPTFDHASPPPELEINGTNFVSGCKVNINGSPKPVIKVSPTKLTVSLAGSVFASATTLKIVVINSSGDTSEEYPVTIT
jgi:hypothetical protein